MACRQRAQIGLAVWELIATWKQDTGQGRPCHGIQEYFGSGDRGLLQAAACRGHQRRIERPIAAPQSTWAVRVTATKRTDMGMSKNLVYGEASRPISMATAMTIPQNQDRDGLPMRAAYMMPKVAPLLKW